MNNIDYRKRLAFSCQPFRHSCDSRALSRRLAYIFGGNGVFVEVSREKSRICSLPRIALFGHVGHTRVHRRCASVSVRVRPFASNGHYASFIATWMRACECVCAYACERKSRNRGTVHVFTVASRAPRHGCIMGIFRWRKGCPTS